MNFTAISLQFQGCNFTDDFCQTIRRSERQHSAQRPTQPIYYYYYYGFSGSAHTFHLSGLHVQPTSYVGRRSHRSQVQNAGRKGQLRGSKGPSSRSVAGLLVLLCIGCDAQIACASRLSHFTLLGNDPTLRGLHPLYLTPLPNGPFPWCPPDWYRYQRTPTGHATLGSEIAPALTCAA